MSQPYDTPLFGDPEPPKAQRVQSHKDRDDAANKITWRRYKVAGIVCWEWVNKPVEGMRCGPAVWLRILGADQRALCAAHRQEYLFQEQRTTKGS